MHTKAYMIFTALLLGGCAFTASVPETPLATSVPKTPLTTPVPEKPAKAAKPKVDAVTTATPEVKKKTQDPRKVTAHPRSATAKPNSCRSGTPRRWSCPPAPPHAGLVFMFAGNLGVPQDLDNVLEGFTRADIPGAELHFVGGGVQLEHLKEKAAASGAHAVFHGRQPKAGMPRWFAQADALIISLTPEYQLTLPGKFQSYIKTGKPILGILLGDARELIDEHQLGVTADPDNLEAIADAFRRMAELIKRGAGPACGACARQLSEQMFDRARLVAALR